MSDEQKKFDDEEFLARWSRLKQQASVEPPVRSQAATDPKDSAPELPPVETLTPESDFRGFLHPAVDDETRRSALKKLFSAPHFNIMDGLDVYIDDYSKSDPLPAETLAQLKQAQKIFEWAEQSKEDTDAKRAGPSVVENDVAASLAGQAPAIAAERRPAEPMQEAEQHFAPQTTSDRKS